MVGGCLILHSKGSSSFSLADTSLPKPRHISQAPQNEPIPSSCACTAMPGTCWGLQIRVLPTHLPFIIEGHGLQLVVLPPVEGDAETSPLRVLAALHLGERELLLDNPFLDVENGPGVEIKLQGKNSVSFEAVFVERKISFQHPSVATPILF